MKRLTSGLAVVTVACALGGMVPGTATATPMGPDEPAATQATQASSQYYTIRQIAKDSANGKDLCLTAGSVGGYVAVVDCNGSSYQDWRYIGASGGRVWNNRANPAYSLAVTSLANGAHATLKANSVTNQTMIFQSSDPSDNVNHHIRPRYATSLCLEPLQWKTNYSNVYLRTCSFGTSGGIQSWWLRVSVIA